MKAIKALAAVAAAFIITWLLCGFVAWNWNPSEWEPMGRFVYVWLASTFGGLSLFAVGISK